MYVSWTFVTDHRQIRADVNSCNRVYKTRVIRTHTRDRSETSRDQRVEARRCEAREKIIFNKKCKRKREMSGFSV